MQYNHKAVVIGAGVSGIYQIKRLTDLGLNAVLLEGDDDLGGTWYRNRYPGARFDSESYSYGYSFSKEVLDEWHWAERFSGQPENLRYLNFVVDKFKLRRHMRFGQRVTCMRWHADQLLWQIDIDNGDVYFASFVFTCLGVLSVPTLPHYPGMDQFKGSAFHTYWWPKEPPELAGRRVGVIGTGATGIQVISDVADKVAQLFVFQRRPNWSTPLNNSPISEQEMANIRGRYDEIFANCAESPTGFEHQPDRRGFWNLTHAERVALWDELYDQPGFALLAGNFPEIFLEEAANKEISDYVANRIRARVHDPKTAEKLIPKDHGFGMQRLPLETRYFEVYNRDNVSLVDLSETPIQSITETGIQTADRHYDLDLITYATGFDAITGALDQIDIIGDGGVALKDKWHVGPRTLVWLMSHGFTNMFMIAGPQSVSGSTNFPRAIETAVNWVTELFEYVLGNDYTRLEANLSAEDEWCEEVVRAHEGMLARRSQGWFTGYNSNLPGREAGQVRYHAYFGSGPRYKERLKEIAETGYSGIRFS
ncbi:MAG: NAD(P)/FAD-dependent oxidoreductase [Pseudomonadota bacterium]